MPEPDTVSEWTCEVCAQTCDVTRGVNGPTSWAASVAKQNRLHDCFRCPSADEDWHVQAMAIDRDIDNCNSPSIQAIMQKDFDDIVGVILMAKIFILEDASYRMEWFLETFDGCEMDYTDNIHVAYDHLTSKDYDLIFLDRDLSHPKENGEDVAWAMMEQKLQPQATVIVHTVNPHGQRAIVKYLKKYTDKVHLIPFTKLMHMDREDFISN